MNYHSLWGFEVTEIKKPLTLDLKQKFYPDMIVIIRVLFAKNHLMQTFLANECSWVLARALKKWDWKFKMRMPRL
jgi:hypothetical protein